MDYQKLLEKARKELPESISQKERFEIPKVQGHLQGSNTVIGNFILIAKTLRRESSHLLKYVLRELAAPGKIVGQRLIIGSKISATQLNAKIRQYANTYVLCKECSKPDTELVSDKNASYIRCTACGAKHPVRLI